MIGFEIDLEKCTECERCMIACSLQKRELVDLHASRVRIVRSWPELPEIRVCRFDDCEGQPCIEACPVEAISSEQDLVLIDEDTCTGCRACVEACPFQAIWMDGDLAFKCDFCQGDPACAKECVTAALLKAAPERGD